MDQDRRASSGGRQQFVQELSKKMSEWDSKVEQITSKSNRGRMDSLLLDDLLQKQGAAHGWLDEVRDAEDAMWQELKPRASVASQDYQDVLEHASQRFKVEGARTAMSDSPRPSGGSEANEPTVEVPASGQERSREREPKGGVSPPKSG